MKNLPRKKARTFVNEGVEWEGKKGKEGRETAARKKKEKRLLLLFSSYQSHISNITCSNSMPFYRSFTNECLSPLLRAASWFFTIHGSDDLGLATIADNGERAGSITT